MAVWDIRSSTDITLRMTITRNGYENYVLAVELSETTIITGSRDKTIKVCLHMPIIKFKQTMNCELYIYRYIYIYVLQFEFD